MRHFRRAVVGVALVTIGLCGWAKGQQVLDQAPADAVGVFEVKDMQAFSGKIARLAKTLGIDQFQPQWADPLGSLMDQMGLKQGVNKSGDMAIAFFDPRQHGAAAEGQNDHAKQPPLVCLIPIDDYKTFLGNFQNVKDAGDNISEVNVPKNGETLFVVQRGKYAEAAMDKALLAKPAGLKLDGPAAKEAQAKDAILYFDMKTARPHLQAGYKQARQGLEKQLQANNPMGAQIPPAMIALLDKAVGQFISDTRSVALSFNINDVGLGTSFVSNFETDSYLGKLAAQAKNTDQPMFAGLPARTYLMFFGAVITPEVATTLLNDVSDVIVKNAANANEQEINRYLDAMKQGLGATKSMAGGVVAPEAGENFIQVVSLTKGNARQIFDSAKQAISNTAAMNALNGGQKVKTHVTLQNPTTVDGVPLQPYTITFEFDPNDPMAAQQKQVMTMLYGRNGIMGNIGIVNDDTVLTVQGGSQKLLTDAITAARKNADNLDDAAELKLVRSQLPSQRGAEFYIALDNVASTVVKIMKQQGLAVQFRLPPNLPPIGVAASTEGSAARVDAFVPTKLVESMTSAVMQTIMQMQGGQGGGI